MFSDAPTGTSSRIGLRLVLTAAIAWCSCLAGVAPGLAREGEVRGALRTTDLLNTDLWATVLDARLDAEAQFGAFTLGGAYRAYHLSDKTYNPRRIEVPQPKIKHRYAELALDSLPRIGNLALGSLALRAGHFFATFDRGLTLRSFEDIDLERDTALDGILGEYQVGPLKVSALSGKTTERISDTRQDEHGAGGARVVMAREGLFSLAASGLKRATERLDRTVALPESLRKFDDTIIGGEAELWIKSVHLAADYAYREGDYYPTLARGEIPGHGGYVSGNLSTAWLTLLGEYKEYRRFENALVNPPTCVREHIWTLMNRTTHQVNLDDERGYLVEGTLTVFEDMPITGSASEARTANGDLAHWEMFGSVERPLGSMGTGSLGASWSREYVSGKFTEYMTVMGEADLTGETGVGLEFSLGGQRIEEPTGDAFANFLGTATWYPTSVVTLSGVAETSTQKNLKRDRWLYGEVGAALGEGFDVALGFGTERGGKKCSGGVCYTEPEFAGLRLRLTKSF
ncbi:MAG: DUF6029 family protein [Candidatus Eisenbacteria bacterium]